MKARLGIYPKNRKSDWFLQSFKGTLPVRVGRHFTTFVESTSGIHMDIKTMRQLVECEMEDAFEAKDITRAERRSVMRANGHTRATVRKFYLPRASYLFHLR